MASLLEKTRRINRVMQRFHSVDYTEMANVLCSVLDANVYIVDAEGVLFGYAMQPDFACELMMDNVVKAGKFPTSYLNWLRRIDETSANICSPGGICVFARDKQVKCKFNGKNTTIVPVFGVGERIGTFIIARYNVEFTEDDLILAEYAAAVVGMEMLHDRARRAQDILQKKENVRMALGSLSISESLASIYIFQALDGKDGSVNASNIARNLNITRSVIVNALRKLESAGVVEPRSQGVKGTHIKVLNEYLWNGIDNLAQENRDVLEQYSHR